MQSNSPKALVEQLQVLLSSSDSANIPKDTKLQACQLARKLWLELEEPGDLIDRMVYRPQEDAMLEVALDLDVYKNLVERKTPASTEELAKAANCNVVLMSRILRTLAALGQIEEVDVDSFAANKFSEAYTTPKGIYGQRNSWDWARIVWQDIPAWLKSIQYQNPSDQMNTALHHAYNYDKHFFEFLAENNFLDNFQAFMSSYRTDRAEFLDIFPAEERLIPGSDENGVLLVDVGGGRGHDIEKFVAKFPQTKGRNILQDQPDVIKDAPASDAFEATAHDFLTPQPVKGARAYYFRMIFHDWPDQPSLTILKHIADAMKPGYSKLLINDIVLPNKGATRFATQSDMNMMALFASAERSEAHWRQLLEQAGFKVVKIWPGVPENVLRPNWLDESAGRRDPIHALFANVGVG